MKTVLAIESAISGGSLAVFGDGELLGSLSGDSGISRAEDLLIKIDELVTETVGNKSKIGSIAISVGPGSFTGLRIGLATVMGLSAALSIKCNGVSLFDAMSNIVQKPGILLTAVPMGRSDVCFQVFDRKVSIASPVIEPRTIQLDHAPDEIARFQLQFAVIHSDLLSRISLPDDIEVISAGTNMAEIIGRYSIATESNGGLEPIYVQSPRFA